MSDAPKKDLDCGDDTKRDQVLKRLLGTPHKPHPKPKAKAKKKGEQCE